jgi:hypothetical protein
MGLRGGLLYGTVAEEILDAVDAPDPVRRAVTAALMAPTPALMTVAALIGADMYNPVGAGEEELLRKSREQNQALYERGIQPGDGVKPGTIVSETGATATLSDTIPTAPQLPPPQVPEPSQRPTTQNSMPPTVSRERVPAASSPVPAVATGGNPASAVEAVEGAAVSALDQAMEQVERRFDDIESDRLRTALIELQQDAVRRRFG